MGYAAAIAAVWVIVGLCMIRFHEPIEKFFEKASIAMYGETLGKRLMMRTGKEAGYVMVVFGLAGLGYVIYRLGVDS